MRKSGMEPFLLFIESVKYAIRIIKMEYKSYANY